MQSSSRGFTLIELLVVIAIIGILSTVVIGSLTVGRLKAADAAIQSDLHAIASQMELYYSSNGNNFGPAYTQSSAQASVPTTGTNVFITDATVNAALKDAMKQSGTTELRGYWVTGKPSVSVPNTSNWAVAVRLKSDTSSWWCIDSSGSPKKEAGTVMTGAALKGGTAAEASCP